METCPWQMEFDFWRIEHGFSISFHVF